VIFSTLHRKAPELNHQPPFEITTKRKTNERVFNEAEKRIIVHNEGGTQGSKRAQNVIYTATKTDFLLYSKIGPSGVLNYYL
jgi:hypothetical protein